MGASGWDYVTPFDGSVERALENLHAQVFQEDYGDDDTYKTLEELYADEEFMGEEGTHSILDIDRVVHTTKPPSEGRAEDFGTLRPLAPDRIAHHFGIDRPTSEQFQARLDEAYGAKGGHVDPRRDLVDECHMRWTGLYVVLYTGDEPTHLGIFGCSGD
ncbi:hypothetical protein [Streptomyces sp. SID12501]|uniref:Uncharacterized protein n=1 Tax=Streptomyces sp. SID12501 TaxID=2706042 RepID=A0A6B3BXB7_9ACTN|nr:hypothetical protein [Streptomyces sp. SID12501]NEC88985.1 hypothetical protein [Streptomyces sp. SID12501]